MSLTCTTYQHANMPLLVTARLPGHQHPSILQLRCRDIDTHFKPYTPYESTTPNEGIDEKAGDINVLIDLRKRYYLDVYHTIHSNDVLSTRPDFQGPIHSHIGFRDLWIVGHWFIGGLLPTFL